MDAGQLLKIIKRLPAAQPITDAYQAREGLGKVVWYAHQKEHLCGWLEEYGGPGAYARARPGQDARHVSPTFNVRRRCCGWLRRWAKSGPPWRGACRLSGPRRSTRRRSVERFAGSFPGSGWKCWRRPGLPEGTRGGSGGDSTAEESLQFTRVTSSSLKLQQLATFLIVLVDNSVKNF